MSSGEKAPRPTLKLRTPVATSRREPAPTPAPPELTGKRPRADWSEPHKSQMQADMDLLAARGKSR